MKRGGFTDAEENLILDLHATLGNRYVYLSSWFFEALTVTISEIFLNRYMFWCSFPGSFLSAFTRVFFIVELQLLRKKSFLSR